MNNYIVFDCETGGLDPEKNPITEIAMIAFQGEDFKEIGRFSTFIAPYGGMVYEPKALEITGITMDMIYSGLQLKEFIKQITVFLKSAKRKGRLKPVLIAHNAAFDQGMLEFAFHCAEQNHYTLVDPIFLDTLHWSRLKDADKTVHKLSVACERSGIEIVNAHRAMDDVEATKQLFTQYVTALRQVAGEGLHNALGEIVDSSNGATTVQLQRSKFKF